MENNQTQPNIPPHHEPFRKASIWIMNPHLKTLLLFLIFALLASGAFLVVMQYKQNEYRQKIYEETEKALPKHETNSLVNQQENTADWLTYKNTQYGFEFKYPKQYALEVMRDDGLGAGCLDVALVQYGYIRGEDSRLYGGTFNFAIDVICQPFQYQFTSDDQVYTTLEEAVANYRYAQLGLAETSKIVNVGDVKGLQNIKDEFLITYVLKDNVLFEIRVLPKDNILANQVYSTLKFISTSSVNPGEGLLCGQAITRAKNTATGEVRDFPTTCLPEGWERVQ